MTQFKKQEIAMYTTTGIGLITCISISSNPVLYMKILASMAAVMGCFVVIYKGILKILNHIYPEANEKRR